jgi:hypothetical protein
MTKMVKANDTAVSSVGKGQTRGGGFNENQELALEERRSAVTIFLTPACMLIIRNCVKLSHNYRVVAHTALSSIPPLSFSLIFRICSVYVVFQK